MIRLLAGARERPCAFGHGVLSTGAMQAAVQALARALPDAPEVINLCEDRAAFAATLAAAAMRAVPVLLPAARDASALAALRRAHPHACTVADRQGAGVAVAAGEHVAAAAASADADGPVPEVPPGQMAALAFTSGSTGEPRAVAKRWGVLVHAARCVDRLVGGAHAVVASVPPQHMYGLESSVLVTLACGWQMHAGRPFHGPAVAAALAALPAPRVLVTTPVHLRALLATAPQCPPVAAVLSATAPLDADLAAQAQDRFGVPVTEIYGCTEAGAIASRVGAEGPWQLFDGMRVRGQGERALLTAPHQSCEIPLPDRIRVLSPERFELLGRPQDMIKVGGKRASATAIQRALCALPGVQDAAVFVPDPDGDGRPAALVVAPGRDAASLRRELAERIDPVFVPRPLRLVDAIPRNPTGKVLRAELLRLLKTGR